MKRFGTAFAVALVALCVTAGCNDYGNTFQGNTGANLTSLSPSNVSAGGPDFVLTVIGIGFVNTCKSGTTSPSCATVVQWNGKNLVTTTTVDSNTGGVLSVTAVVPAALTATPGRAFVNTLNPKTSNQNNGLSQTVAFIINVPANPVPQISDISPKIVAPGSGDLTITVNGPAPSSADPCGGCFLQNTATGSPSNGSVVMWNSGATQTTLATTFISQTQLTATVPAALLGVQACAIVTVFNPPTVDPNNPAANGGGGTSPHGQTFTVSTNASFCPAAAMQAAQGAAMVAEETPAVSLDGRFVAYAGQQGTHSQIFLRDTCEGAASECIPGTAMLSLAQDNSEGNGDSHNPTITSDGRYVAFSSAATNLVAEAPAGKQIFLRDTCHGADVSCKPQTQLVSVDPNGLLSATDNLLPSISASGRYVAFLSVKSATTKTATSHAASQINNGVRQVFVRDTCIGAPSGCTPKTTRISTQPGDANAVGGKPAGPAMSGGGSSVGIADNHSATLFTHAVAVDDRVFLAITKGQP
ncbi:MAG TPA: hypothetical protein VKD70_15800 [Candidatus Acidoferrum sp.]|nr:hypothetical protein [Candidatus Acidoferrum sp.]